MSEVALLEYQAVVHEIFIELLMNSDMHFCPENISELKAYLQMKMEYFTVWHEAMSKGKVNNEKANLTFISTQTWVNLRFAICGFIGFAEYVLQNNRPEDVQYVPVLYSNTSNIESTFSHMKSLGGRDAQSYQTRIASRSVSDSITAISKSSSYSVGEYLPEQDIQDGHDHPALIKSMNQELVEMKESWIQKFDQNTKVAVAIVPAGTGLNGKGSRQWLISSQWPWQCMGSMEYYVLSKHSGRAAMFQRLANLSKEEELQLN
jgi:hypothetical protein